MTTFAKNLDVFKITRGYLFLSRNLLKMCWNVHTVSLYNKLKPKQIFETASVVLVPPNLRIWASMGSTAKKSCILLHCKNCAIGLNKKNWIENNTVFKKHFLCWHRVSTKSYDAFFHWGWWFLCKTCADCHVCK